MSDAKFLAWIRTLPSCLSGDGPCQAAHVRRVQFGSGTGIKPPFSAVPLTFTEHYLQHSQGELASILAYGDFDLEEPTPQFAKDWFTEKALEYRKQWEEMNEKR